MDCSISQDPFAPDDTDHESEHDADVKAVVALLEGKHARKPKTARKPRKTNAPK